MSARKWMDCPAAPAYVPRFVTPAQGCELVNLYHLARTALSPSNPTPHQRMLWASDAFHKANLTISSTGAYKDLCGLLDR